jgi:hypothetical protein
VARRKARCTGSNSEAPKRQRLPTGPTQSDLFWEVESNCERSPEVAVEKSALNLRRQLKKKKKTTILMMVMMKKEKMPKL